MLLFTAFSNSSGSDESQSLIFIKAEKGQINILKSGEYIIKHQNEILVLKKVRAFIWLNNEPYFEDFDKGILRWNKVLSGNSAFGLQQVADKLYFLKQHSSSGSEWEDTSLNIIDQKGNIREVMLYRNGKSVTTEYYGIFGDRYFIENAITGFCVLDKSGNALACYPWPKK